MRLRCISWRSEGPRRGTVVICTGRTEFVEKYDEVVQQLLDRDLDVVAFDWRGQGLSDRFLPDRAKGHVRGFEDYLADLDTVTGLIEARSFPRPRLMLAHSMGGQIGLRFVHDRPAFFAAAAMTAPMFGIQFNGLPGPLAKATADLMCLAGRSEAYAFGQGPRAYALGPFEGNLLTSSPDQYHRLRTLLEADPELALGGPTFSWLSAALGSVHRTQRASFARTVKCPMLLAVGGHEGIVDVKAIERITGWLPNAELVHIPHARHEILIEQEPLRAQFWSAFDRWLSQPAGAAPPPSP
jgi:lysophospholipase